MTNPVLHLLGLAKRAGKLEIGEEPVGAVARAKQAKLILLAHDVSPNTSRRAATFGQIGNVLHLTLPCTKDELGQSLGRNSVAMVALTDAGFAGAIGDKLAEIDKSRYGAASKKLREKADRTLARQREKRQHEKNLQRGKGKPWAVPLKTQEAQQIKKEKKKSFIDSNPELHKKDSHQKPGSNSNFKKNATKKVYTSKNNAQQGKYQPVGKKLVMKRRTGPSDQS